MSDSRQIHCVRLQRFRRIQEPLEVDLTTTRGADVSQALFSGPNSSGKTTVLEAMLLGLGTDSLIVRDLERSGREEHWRVSVPEAAEIELDVSLDGKLQTWLRTSDRFVIRSGDGIEPHSLQNREWRRIHSDSATRIDAQIVDPDAEERLADLFVLDSAQSAPVRRRSDQF
ncbi:MAG: hypothetical protein QM784_27750 [Polyangiaceae bacterium]